MIEESWFSGSLVGQSSESVDWDGRYVGGLAGESWAGDIRNAWSAGSVEGRSELGGFVGVQNGGLITAGWAASEILAESVPRGGFIAISKNVKESYWGKGALGQNDGGISSDPSDPREYFGVDSLQTISVSAWDAGIWNFGDSKLGEGDRNADFPILRAVDSDQQAAGIASGLTRILHTHSGGLTTLNARATTTIYTNMTLSAAVMRLDTNGPAANEGGETSNPQCSLSGGVLVADTGYNGATVRGNAANAVLSDLRSNCEFLLRPLAVPSETALSFYIVAGAVTMRRVYHLSIADGIVWENDGPPIIAGAGATVLIDALAPGLAAVTVIDADDAGARRNGAIVTYAAQSPYFAVSERGAGTVWLADSAVNLFEEDNKELTLVVTVSDGQAKPLSATATIFFRSGPRAIDGDALTLMIEDFQRGATVLASHLVAATIRHAEESYSLDDGYGFFAANSGDGEIVLAADIVAAGGWTVILRATSADGSVTATQRMAILASPPQDGNPYNDGYFGEGGKGEGTAENPFRIYNIEQLQAIDGVVPAEVATDLSSAEVAQALTLFGANAEESRSLHYVLANDIDATATRGWNGGKGFDPIGETFFADFSGVFDGGGREVRGLWIERPYDNENDIGLFAGVSGAIVSLGVTDAHVRGNSSVGGLAGWSNGIISSSWSSGLIWAKYGSVGGLIGKVRGGVVSSSWSLGAVSGHYGVGGLVGDLILGTISSSWSSAAVSGISPVGGLVGGVDHSRFNNYFNNYAGGWTIASSWSSGVVSSRRNIGGLVGRNENSDSTTVSYWSVETSGAKYSGGGIGVDTLQTISVAAWGADVWRFGGDRDFPILVSHDADRQEAGIASGLTRILNVYGGLEALDARATTGIYALIEERATSGFAVLQLDTNGLAANEGEIGETSKPVCDLRDGVLRAGVGYNGVTVKVRSENAALSELQSDCKFALHSLSVSDEVALSVDIVAGAITMSRVYNLSVAGGVRHSAPAVINSGSTIFIAADAAARSAAATVIAVAADERVSATFVYAAQSPYFTVSERGEGTVRLSDSAINIFGDEDNKELTLVVTVSNERAPTLLATAPFYFRSTPRAIDGGALTVAIGDFRQGATVLASRLVKAKVLHAEESYSLDDDYGLFAANSGNGEIVLATNIVERGEWTVVLRATSADGSVTATQRVAILASSPPRGDNPYNEGYSDEGGKGEGTPENPFRIYNIEQLQAIDGVVPEEVAADLSSAEVAQALTLFGASKEESRSRHYVLANDIDATATRGWNGGKGFDPIGGNFNTPFSGVFDGGGREVRGLWIDRQNERYIGFFGATSGVIASLGVSDAYIRGKGLVGGMVGYVDGGTISSSWSSGVVLGDKFVGGLVGVSEGVILSSWSSSAASGDELCIGGLVGELVNGTVSSSWSSGAVSGGVFVGGLVGLRENGVVSSSWSSGVVSGEGSIGGLVGEKRYNGGGTFDGYWSVETSNARYSESGIGVDTLQTLSVTAWDANAWGFGGDRDFPVLVSHDADRQAAEIASGLTRVLHVYGDLAALDARATTEIYALIEEGATSGFAVLQLDTNGLAANEGETGETSKPVCDLSDGVLSAAVGYNGVTVKVRSENAALSDLQSDCKFELHSLSVLGEAALSVDIVAGAVTLRRVYNLSVAGGVRHSAPVIVNSGTTIFIAADAAAGSAAATVIAIAVGEQASATFAYAAQSPYFTVSEKGAGAIWLADSVIDIFGDEEYKELTLVVTVSNERAPTLLATATFYFRSAPRAIDGGALTVTIGDFQRGALALPSRLVEASILHAEESYSLGDGYGLFAANPDDGAISLTADIFVSGAWTVVLRAWPRYGSIAAVQTICVSDTAAAWRRQSV